MDMSISLSNRKDYKRNVAYGEFIFACFFTVVMLNTNDIFDLLSFFISVSIYQNSLLTHLFPMHPFLLENI